MHVVESTLRSILEGSKQYVVPLYQRPYAWKSPNWQTIWTDIIDLSITRKKDSELTHFTGTLVLDASSVTTDLTQFLVVDGQQRLTTLSIILATIASHHDGQGNSQDAQRIRDLVLINPYAETPEQKYRLRPANFDEDVYRSAVDGNIKKSSQSYIDDAYMFFEKKLKELSQHELEISDVESTVLKGLKFVTITAKAEDNVYRIFESINNTGIDLTQADLIRNLVFMRLGNQSKLVYESIWLPLQKELDAEDLENLFWIDAMWRNPDVRKFDTYEYQKQVILSLSTEGLIEYLQQALKIAEALRLFRFGTGVSSDSGLFESITRLRKLAVPGALVLIIKVLFETSGDETEAVNALKVIESYLVRRAIAAVPISNLGRICAGAAHELTDDIPGSIHKYLSTGKRKYLTDKQILEIICSSPMYGRGRKAHLALIIEWLVQVDQGKDKLDYSKMTIEHVLPQSLKGEARTEFAALLAQGEDVDIVHESLVDTLGNLTLTHYNSELSNKAFSEKRASWLQNTAVLANQEISESTNWGPMEIKTRSENLAKRAIELWAGPDESLLEYEPASLAERIDQIIPRIPEGYWASYGAIASVVGTNSQTIGQRVSKALIPGAWRVLKSNGKIAENFSWPSGSEYEGRSPREVLESEGVIFDSQGYAHEDFRITAEEILDRVDEGE